MMWNDVEDKWDQPWTVRLVNQEGQRITMRITASRRIEAEEVAKNRHPGFEVEGHDADER